jgi:3-oxoacyl-(acyl-carrier-protein) synthase
MHTYENSGAVKSNIGHLEGASGLAGLVKTVLILEQGIIPPNANFQQLNNRIGLGPNIKASSRGPTVIWY